ncbi:Csu type fimbrial protein [Acinetobacter sp. ESBL14]|uniref:Csu type fimbrial protein n=1 Tax=Acinetobacter sp. ESBL14 TaxID=3077329 RepID=UPI002FCB5FF7
MKRIIFIVLLLGSGQPIYAAAPQTKSSFIVQATIEKGCSLVNSEQNMDFGQHSALSQEKITSSIINTNTTWSIKCTERMPVSVMLDAGEYFDVNHNRRMKNSSSSEYINYKLYTSSSLNTEYMAGNIYPLSPTTAANSILDFSVYGVADLDNNNQFRSAGIYKDTVSILISW